MCHPYSTVNSDRKNTGWENITNFTVNIDLDSSIFAYPVNLLICKNITFYN